MDQQVFGVAQVAGVHGVNTFFVKIKGRKEYVRDDEVRHDWEAGVEFKAHLTDETVAVKDELRMRMAGFTELWIVWWDGERVRHVKKELK
jgi:hypothetical protein